MTSIAPPQPKPTTPAAITPSHSCTPSRARAIGTPLLTIVAIALLAWLVKTGLRVLGSVMLLLVQPPAAQRVAFVGLRGEALLRGGDDGRGLFGHGVALVGGVAALAEAVHEPGAVRRVELEADGPHGPVGVAAVEALDEQLVGAAARGRCRRPAGRASGGAATRGRAGGPTPP
jgi:hypothetical protein